MQFLRLLWFISCCKCCWGEWVMISTLFSIQMQIFFGNATTFCDHPVVVYGINKFYHREPYTMALYSKIRLSSVDAKSFQRDTSLSFSLSLFFLTFFPTNLNYSFHTDKCLEFSTFEHYIYTSLYRPACIVLLLYELLFVMSYFMCGENSCIELSNLPSK